MHFASPPDEKCGLETCGFFVKFTRRVRPDNRPRVSNEPCATGVYRDDVRRSPRNFGTRFTAIRSGDQLTRKRRSRRLFVTTDTLDRAIAAEAMIGDNSQPVQG
jgi:hypothetical protein